MDHRGAFKQIEEYYRGAQPRWVRTEDRLNGYEDTVSLIVKWAKEFSNDLTIFKELNLSIYHVFLYSRSLPYNPDPVGLETVSRPLITLNPDWTGPRDCDDKTLQILAACRLFGIPGRPVVVGQTNKPHHIYPEIKIPGNTDWIPADSTYPDRSVMGQRLYGEIYRHEFPEIA